MMLHFKVQQKIAMLILIFWEHTVIPLMLSAPGAKKKKNKIMTTDSLFFDMHPVLLYSLCLTETRSKTVVILCCVDDTGSMGV